MQTSILLHGHLQSYSLIFLDQPGQLFAVQGRWMRVDEEIGMGGNMQDINIPLSRAQPLTGLGRGKQNSAKSGSFNVMADAFIFQLQTAHCVVIFKTVEEMNRAKIIQNHTTCLSFVGAFGSSPCAT